MNFTPFGSPFSASIPIHQFAAKFAHDGSAALQPQMVSSGTVVLTANDGVRYLRAAEHGNAPTAHFGNQAAISMPVNMGKYMRPGDMASHQQASQPVTVINPNAKYHMTAMPIHHFHPAAVTAAANVVAVPYSQAMVVQQIPSSNSTPVPVSCQSVTSPAAIPVHMTTTNTQSGTPGTQTTAPVSHSVSPTTHQQPVHLQIPNPQVSLQAVVQNSQVHTTAANIQHTPPTSQPSANIQPSSIPSPQTTAVSVQTGVQTSPPAPQQPQVVNVQHNMQGSTAPQNVDPKPMHTFILDNKYEVIEMQPQELCAAMLRENAAAIAEAEKVIQASKGASTKGDEGKDDSDPKQVSNEYDNTRQYSQQVAMPWQSIATPGSAVAEYLSRLPTSTLPLTLHHFLKFSSENIKKEPGTIGKKQKKKKKMKEKKPRPKPGEIRLTTALDGSTLYCCPECHMAYPERELLVQHMMGHKLERRFVCNICGAGLKRKEHLDRHKQGHNPERPYVCTVCLKGFKRNEHLTRHFIIHSGEKNHICTECGKAFYRKDHLRKHAQTHIAKRVKAELSQQGVSVNSVGQMIPTGTMMPVASVPSMASLASMASMVSVGTMTPVTAVALMPDGATVPIIT